MALPKENNQLATVRMAVALFLRLDSCDWSYQRRRERTFSHVRTIYLNLVFFSITLLGDEDKRGAVNG